LKAAGQTTTTTQARNARNTLVGNKTQEEEREREEEREKKRET